jgi:hypothetical protein
MLNAIRSVHIVSTPLDMRRSFDGLLAAARHLQLDPYNGCCVVFLSRSRHILKAVVGDEKGILLLCRRFEGGGLPRLFEKLLSPEVRKISQAQLLFLFEGCTVEVKSEAPSWRPLPPP